MDKKGQVPGFVWAGFVIFVLIILGLFMAFDTVDASHIGVKNKFGVIKGTMMPGLAYTGMLVHVEQFDLRLRSMTVDMADGASAVDKDGLPVYATIQINYKLNPDNIVDLYTKIGKDKVTAQILNIDGIIREGFKTATSQYNALEIIQNRQAVKESAITKIEANFPEQYFDLENVIISNIEFPTAYSQAIADKQTSIERAKAEENNVRVETALANQAIERARGEAESEALKILKQAEAEARSLELKAQELTPLMVQNNWIDAWQAGGAQVPMYITAGSGQQFLMQLPTLG